LTMTPEKRIVLAERSPRSRFFDPVLNHSRLPDNLIRWHEGQSGLSRNLRRQADRHGVVSRNSVFLPLSESRPKFVD
jgi:hypothetical protein